MDDTIKRPAYDPGNLHPDDEESRKYDNTSDGMDWDEIIASTQDDWLARRFAFNSDDYPDHETAMAALRQLIHSIAEKVKREMESSASGSAAASA